MRRYFATTAMRILHISTRLILGGSQENTVLSCEGQARLGHEVHLAFGPIYGPEGSLLDRARGFRAGDNGIETHIVPHLVREVNPIADFRSCHELRRLISDVRPDIVHTHSSKAGIVGRWAAWTLLSRSRKRSSASGGHRLDRSRDRLYPGIVHTIHGPPFMPVEGSPLRRTKIRLVNKTYEIAERSAARRCHVIVSVADAMTREFFSRGIGRADQYLTVHSGMETARFLTPGPGESRAEVRARLGLAESDFVIGTVARLAEHKGHDDLLDALGEDLRANPSWKLLWVGDGWWRERLVAKGRTMGLGVRELDREDGQRTADSEKLTSTGDAARIGSSPAHRLTVAPSQVILTGLVPPDRVPGLVRSMDVLAHPSYREGLPRTVPQALLCGVCPVAYDVDGTREACRDGETGRLVRPGHIAGLRAAVRALHDDPAARTAMASRGRELCRELFSAERMVARLEEVYARALDLARKPA